MSKFKPYCFIRADFNGFKVSAVGTDQSYKPVYSTDQVKELLGQLQAKIDSLMLEFCPGEMTEIQLSNWKLNQIKKTTEFNLTDLSISSYETGSAWVYARDGITVTHIPTGLSVSSHEERSQHKNKQICIEKLKVLVEKCTIPPSEKIENKKGLNLL